MARNKTKTEVMSQEEDPIVLVNFKTSYLVSSQKSSNTDRKGYINHTAKLNVSQNI